MLISLCIDIFPPFVFFLMICNMLPVTGIGRDPAPLNAFTGSYVPCQVLKKKGTKWTCSDKQRLGFVSME